MKKTLQLSMALLFVLILFQLSVNAKTIRVPQDSATIQLAINASTNGDTVLVDEGTYQENINFKGKNITVASRFIIDNDLEHITKTIVDGRAPVNVNNGSVVIFNSGETQAATLAGFTITKGRGTLTLNNGWIEGGGILIENSAATIKFNMIVDNETVLRSGAKGGGGGGISSIRSNPVIMNNVIVNNTAGYAGGIVLNWSAGTIRNNIIYDNHATGSWGTGGLMIWNAPEVTGNPPQIIENNTIVGNSAITTAGGLSIDKTANPSVIKNLVVWGNTQPTGGQIKNNGLGIVTYSNVEGGFTGTGNINSEPLFMSQFEPGSGSPCIDAGDPAGIYNDISDLENTSKALKPAHGTLLNDMGVYGGPYAAELPVFEIRQELLKGTPHIISSIETVYDKHSSVKIFPNPAIDNAFIEFNLNEDTDMEINLFDITGRKIYQVINTSLPAGTCSVNLNTSGLSDGIYFCQFKTGNVAFEEKLIISKK